MPVDGGPRPDGFDDSDPGTVTYERDTDERPSRSVVRAVSAAIGRDPAKMDPLCDAVDPDALNGLVEPAAGERVNARVTFRFNECTVAVYGDGRTVVSPPDVD